MMFKQSAYFSGFYFWGRCHNFVSVLALILLTVFVLVGCNQSVKPVKAEVTTSTTVSSDPMILVLNAQMQERVEIAPLEEVPLVTAMNVPGRIEVDERRLSRIGSNVTGRVVEVLVSVGDQVRAGQLLARISSPELSNAQLAYMRAASAEKLAEKAADRATQLYAADVIGRAELLKRQAEAQIARAEMNAAAEQLVILGMSRASVERLKDAGDIQAFLPVVASQSGVLIDRKVVSGQVVQPADQLFAVADLSSLWVVGGVPEQVARDVAVNQIVEVMVPALYETLRGKIVYVSDTVSPDTRTVTVRTELSNPERLLKPAMLANLKITSSATHALAVPVSAVVREENKDFVFIQVDQAQFKMVEVKLGAETAGFRRVLQGLVKGQVFIKDGAFHLNNERKRAELG